MEAAGERLYRDTGVPPVRRCRDLKGCHSPILHTHRTGETPVSQLSRSNQPLQALLSSLCLCVSVAYLLPRRALHPVSRRNVDREVTPFRYSSCSPANNKEQLMSANDTPAPPGAVFYLSCPAVPWSRRKRSLPKEVNGQRVGYFWADGIRAGKYVHPAGKFELHVDGPRLDGWVCNFRKMREAGVDVPVPVDHSTRARDNLGYVVDVKREGDTLKLLHQLIGEEAIRLAARNKVSLGIDPAFTDGQGRAFGDCVVHSSLTPVPLVPGQEGLVPLSAAARAVVFHLAKGGFAQRGRRGRFRGVVRRGGWMTWSAAGTSRRLAATG